MNDKTSVTGPALIRAGAFELAAETIDQMLEHFNRDASTSMQAMVDAHFARRMLGPISKLFKSWSADELAGDHHTAKGWPKPTAPRPTPREIFMAELRRPLSTREVLLFFAGMQCASLFGVLIGGW